MLHLKIGTLNTTENNNILKIQFIFHVMDRSSQGDQVFWMCNNLSK